jgi:Domain of unknown function (DUF4157)
VRLIQASGTGAVELPPGQLRLSPREVGRPLPEPVRSKLEGILQADFSAVRVHIGQEAASIGAYAFTSGWQIFFAPGQYRPESLHGVGLIAHELAHVVQQRQGRAVNPFGHGIAVLRDPLLEAEAERARIQATQSFGRISPPAGARGVRPGSVVLPQRSKAVQRMPKSEISEPSVVKRNGIKIYRFKGAQEAAIVTHGGWEPPNCLMQCFYDGYTTAPCTIHFYTAHGGFGVSNVSNRLVSGNTQASFYLEQEMQSAIEIKETYRAGERLPDYQLGPVSEDETNMDKANEKRSNEPWDIILIERDMNLSKVFSECAGFHYSAYHFTGCRA